MDNEERKESTGQPINVENKNRLPRKPRLKKADKAVYYELLVEDIRANGPRQPIEWARKYGLSEKQISKFLIEAHLNGDIGNETIDYSATSLWNIKAFIQTTMGLGNKALVKIEGDKSALLITPLE